ADPVDGEQAKGKEHPLAQLRDREDVLQTIHSGRYLKWSGGEVRKGRRRDPRRLRRTTPRHHFITDSLSYFPTSSTFPTFPASRPWRPSRCSVPSRSSPPTSRPADFPASRPSASPSSLQTARAARRCRRLSRSSQRPIR